MKTIKFDLDGVISPIPFFLKEAMIANNDETFFYFLQKSRSLQKAYNFCFRKPNLEIRFLMEELEKMGFETGIISASNVNCREELERWLAYNGFYYSGNLILKESSGENTIDYKKRVVPANCDRYLDDREDIVRAINETSNGKCKAILYTGQPKKELFRELFPVFV